METLKACVLGQSKRLCRNFGIYCPETWSLHPYGKFLAEREQDKIDRVCADVFGYFAVQIGEYHRDLLRSSPITRKIKLGRSARCDVRADAGSLPFEDASIDMLTLAHVLEFSHRPQNAMREAYRVLRPEGHLFLLCFNHLSLLGLRSLLDLSSEYPWHGEFFSIRRLGDWLDVLGMVVAGGSYIGYAPPGTPPSQFSVWEKAGDRWWPMFGGIILLHAIKRLPSLRLQPAWTEARRKAKARAVVAPADGTRHTRF